MWCSTLIRTVSRVKTALSGVPDNRSCQAASKGVQEKASGPRRGTCYPYMEKKCIRDGSEVSHIAVVRFDDKMVAS